MNSEESRLSSDDEDLPDLFGGNNDATKEKFEIAQHDIVWAEFRKLYWPALVRCVMKKERKASVWYLDSPGKCFKVPFRKIKSFSDPEMTSLIKGEIENSPMKAIHKRVWLNAITYIRRKTQGYTDDPASFFDLNVHYLAYKDNDFDRPISVKIEDSDTTLQEKSCGTTLREEVSVEASSDEESLLSDDEEENVINKRLSVFNNLDESYEDDPRVDDIVKCIVAGYVDKHLLRVKAKKANSSYQELYENTSKTSKEKLMCLTPSSHVRSTAKLKEIAVYLMNFYEKAIEGGKCEMVNYVMYVWVPEAIDKAVELISDGSINLDKVIPETRRKLFPTDKLIIEEASVPFQNDSVIPTNGKKRVGSRKGISNQPKKVKVSEFSNGSSCDKKIESCLKSPSKAPIKPIGKRSKQRVKSSIKKENKMSVKSPKKKSEISVKSPTKKEIEMSLNSPNKKESEMPVKFPNKKESIMSVNSPSKKKSKMSVKSPNKKETTMPEKSPKKNESEMSVKSPTKKEREISVNSLNKKESEMPVKSPNKKVNKMSVNSPNKKKSKMCVKSPNKKESTMSVKSPKKKEFKTGTRSSPRKKV